MHSSRYTVNAIFRSIRSIRFRFRGGDSPLPWGAAEVKVGGPLGVVSPFAPGDSRIGIPSSRAEWERSEPAGPGARPRKGGRKMSSVHRAPRGLSAAGRRLWDAVSSDFELEAHESVLLESAARTADLVADLQSLIDREGLVLGGKTHPGVAEIRQQRLVLARLLAALRVPTGDEDDRPSGQRRPIRGVYRLDHAS